jgi:hypothetical protein
MSMKTFRLLALLLLVGAFQANATGFAHNMNQAQKMLKTKKEVVAHKRVPRSDDRNKASEGAGKASRNVSDRESFEGRGTSSFQEEADPISERVINSFSNWVSQLLMNAVSSALGHQG